MRLKIIYDMDKLKMRTTDLTEGNVKKIASLFPGCLTEQIDESGKKSLAIDFDLLKQELSDHVVDGLKERYRFTWPDKRKALLLANSPISKTLRPLRNKSVNFDDTENIYIEGDNLDALKLLQETYLKKFKLIYLDPPYNTGRNLIYKNDFHISSAEYLSNSGQHSEDGSQLVANLETNGQFHTDWLNMIYPRLRIAKNLLADDGVLVCAMDENEFDTLSLVLKEIWGESTYDHTCVTVVHNPRGVMGNNFSRTNEYAFFVYPKNLKVINDRRIEEEDVTWSQLRNWGSESERTDAKNCFYPIFVKDGEIIGFGDVTPDNVHPSQTEIHDGIYYVYPIDRKGIERKWRYARQTVESILSMLKASKTDTGYDILLGKNFGTQRTVWADKKYDANEYGTKIINELVPGSDFSFPKSLWTLYDTVYAVTANDKNALILDFFSGSGTTAHAVMKLNSEDGGNRKFVMVQVPEPLEGKKGFKTICDIGEERIRRAGERILSEMKVKKDGEGLFASSDNNPKLDVGFRVLRLDSSNMEDVYYRPEDSSESTLFEDNVKPDRTGEDLLFQVMLECNLPLSAKIQTEKIAGKEVFSVNNGYLIACFDEDVNEEVITAVAKRKPYYFIMRDKSLSSDNVADNFEQIFQAYSKETIRRIL